MKNAFLSYARINETQALRLYQDLGRNRSLRVWFDQVDLLPGVRWKSAIRKAIRESDYFVALLSHKAVTGRGYRHSELREAVEVMREFPSDRVYLIPVRLDKCQMPLEELDEFHYADLFPDWKEGIARMLAAMGLKSSRPAANVEIGTTSSPDERFGGRPGRGQTKINPGNRRVPKHPRYHYTVTLVNLGPSRAPLERVATGLNRVQSFFRFQAAKASLPVSAVKLIESTPQLDVSSLSRRFYQQNAPLKSDMVIGFTEHLLTLEEEGYRYWNHLGAQSAVDDRVWFQSHANLVHQAGEAGIPPETGLAYAISSAVVSYLLDIDYHKATRNCPLDFTEDHADTVGGMQMGRFCPACLKKLRKNPSLFSATTAMLAWGR